MKYLVLILTAFCFLSAPVEAISAESKLVTVKTPQGGSQPFLFAAPDKPKAGVILFVGGDGVLGISDSGHVTKTENNFLVRAYEDFVNKGLMVALVDVPSGKKKMTPKFRISKQHAGDMIAVIKYMNKKADVPVWLIGTSLGTFSAASVAIKKQKRVSGLVLTSTVTRSDKKYKITMKFPKGVLGLNLNKFKKPVLIVAHKGDECVVSPPADASKLKRKLSRSSRVEVAMLDGGDDPKSDPCHGLSQHGFFGIEGEAVDRIAKFITQ